MARKRTRKTASHANRKRGRPPSSRRRIDAKRVADRQAHPIKVGNRVFAARPAALAGRRLDILPDMPDIRDRIYQPHLRALHPAIYPKIAFSVRDQG
jgi:hypothetical protein